MASERTNSTGIAVRFVLILLAGLSISSLAALAAPGLGAGTIVSCPFRGTGTSSVSNGFYVVQYPGNNLSRVTLAYTATYAELYAISLTAHRDHYDGPVIGSTQTATVMVPTSGEALVTFDFGGAPVSPGDAIAFTQDFAIYGPVGAELFYDPSFGACPGVYETAGTSPLSPPLNAAAGISITQVSVSPEQCVASDTVLCLDDHPGDHRFQVTATFHTAEGGGFSGDAQAFPLRPRGASHGGLFWFFDFDNPEILVKIVNGCAVNDRFWAFVTAGTNVGFSVTISDTFLARTKTYSNPDLTAALPIQDTAALASCHPCLGNDDCRTGLLCCFTLGGTGCFSPVPGGGCPIIP
jgi:hypothetical protein